MVSYKALNTIRKSKISNISHTIRNDYFGQRDTTLKNTFSNISHTIRNDYFGQRATTKKA